VLGRTYEGQNCSAARALEVVGERWSLLIVRDALFAGTTRFSDFQKRLGLATNVLKTRLDTFVEAGVMERRSYSNHPGHHEYLLTDSGRELRLVVIALSKWGDRWVAPNGAPVRYEHAVCGELAEPQLRCESCGEVHDADEIQARPGPGRPPDDA
jgi:DNA-binding HxlR family transcriptional regulator